MSALHGEFAHDGERVAVSCRHLRGGRYRVQVGEQAFEVAARALPDGRVRFWLEGRAYEAASAPVGKSLQVRVAGHTWLLAPAVGRARAEAKAGAIVEAPMTGTISAVRVAEGESVAKGQALIVLTAMKMEHKLVAGVAGRVAELRAAIGATVEQGALLVRLEPAG
jgi:acetyl/propionyl-CoA carboxylase alpha subunit